MNPVAKGVSLSPLRAPAHRFITHFPTDPQPELVAQLAQETYNTDLLYHLVAHISRFEFESRKDVAQIFSLLLRRQIGSRFPTVENLASKPDVIFAALKGYENEEVALNTSMILKEMLKHEQLAKILLYSDEYVSVQPPATHAYRCIDSINSTCILKTLHSVSPVTLLLTSRLLFPRLKYLS